MAKQKDAQPEAPPQKSVRKKGLLIGVLVAVVVVLAAGGGGAWFLLHHKSDEHAAQAKPKGKPSAPPIFVTLEPFVVNMAGEVQHFLQLGIDLRVADGSVSDQVKLHMPEIRNGVLLLISSKKVEDLASVEQKNRLRDEIREAVNKPLGIDTPAPKPAEMAVGGVAPPVGAAQAAEAPKPAVATIRGPQADSGVLEVLLTSFVIQ
jgi:flagellar FliL protein